MAQLSSDAIRGLVGSEADDPRAMTTVLYRSQEGSLWRNHARTDSQLTVYGENRHASMAPHRQVAVQRMDTQFPRRPNPRRRFGLLGVFICVLGLGYLFKADRNITATDYAARTKHVLSTTPLIDGHNDMPYLIRIELKNHIYDKRFTFRDGLLSPTDLAKLRTGGVGGQFWSAYMPCVDNVADDFNIPTVANPNH
jgi:hypothetical protein